MNVLVNIRKQAQFNRTYEPLETNDLVRIYIKKTVQTKSRDPKYSKEVYKIIGKSGNQYLINDHRKKVYNRWELFKVPDGTNND
jgi:ribosomal protein L21E